MHTGTFAPLLPDYILSAVEEAYNVTLDGMLNPLPSYINRVFALTSDGVTKYVVKFYRPGRWTKEAILEEHRFLFDCEDVEIPVVTPICESRNESLSELSLEDESGEHVFFFSLFPLKAGYNFEAYRDEDWIRLGMLVGRVHAVGKARQSDHRMICLPESTTLPFINELEDSGLVTPEEAETFIPLLRRGYEIIAPRFADFACQRIHGDCHRGNIFDRDTEGLLLFDFDDMMHGPAVQDLWLLLPNHAHKCQRELNLLVEGYEQFSRLENRSLQLIEPLRFMRMVYFLLWCARQKDDFQFLHHFPDWGTKKFWQQEMEDFAYQVDILEEYGTESSQ